MEQRPEPIILALASLTETVGTADCATALRRIEEAERCLVDGTDLSRHPIQEEINAAVRLDPDFVRDIPFESGEQTWGHLQYVGDPQGEDSTPYLDRAWETVAQVGSPPLPFGRVLAALGYRRGQRFSAGDIERLQVITQEYSRIYEMAQESPSLLSVAQKMLGLAAHHHTLASRHSSPATWPQFGDFTWRPEDDNDGA